MIFFLVIILAAVDMTFYNLLGVKAEATQAEINSAFRKKLLTTHPDKIGSTPENVRRFQKLSHAKDILSDPELRKVYDLTGKKNPMRANAPDPKDTAPPKNEAPKTTRTQQARERLAKIAKEAKEKLTSAGTAVKEGARRARTDFASRTKEAASKFKSTFTKATGAGARPAGEAPRPKARPA